MCMVCHLSHSATKTAPNSETIGTNSSSNIVLCPHVIASSGSNENKVGRYKEGDNSKNRYYSKCRGGNLYHRFLRLCRQSHTSDICNDVDNEPKHCHDLAGAFVSIG
mmetsp:Transcript_13909/g.17494  ORF Transcript_13909/g.17494 Transcript_13909/m.17494 type:complete len:107 (+) Transcript_13909:162-482(+)